jgi:hypothetical protein
MAHQELKDADTGQLISELKSRFAKAILRRLNSVFTARDATVFALASVLGIAVDILFFTGGLSTAAVSLFYGVGGTAAYKLWKHTGWAVGRALKRINDWRSQQLITDEQADELVRALIHGHISMDEILLPPPSSSPKDKVPPQSSTSS